MYWIFMFHMNVSLSRKASGLTNPNLIFVVVLLIAYLINNKTHHSNKTLTMDWKPKGKLFLNI